MVAEELHPAVQALLEAGPSASVRLEVPLETLGDPWPALRAIWSAVLPNGTLTVRYGGRRPFALRSADVGNLLRLASFRQVSSYGVDDASESVGRRVDRRAAPLSCTVIVPCRNEVDNVAPLVERVPEMGTETEIVFVDGASDDGTPDKIREIIAATPAGRVRLVEQAGNTGKAGATFQGLAAAKGDVVMILDADMTVRPEDLPRFYYALAEDVADVGNGTRLVFPMEAQAMPAVNRVGNMLFRRYISWLVHERLTDTLCGTKAVLRKDLPAILANRRLFGEHDPWGDFDLLMSAARCRLRIIDVPVLYRARVAGESKMRPFAHGLELAKTCAMGAVRLKLRL